MPSFIDITGQRFGRLTVQRRAENKGRYVAWVCVCDCGQTVVPRGTFLRDGTTKSCGCLQREAASRNAKAAALANLQDLTDQRFGRLVVTERVGTVNHSPLWSLRCDCGGGTELPSDTLRDVTIVDRSCGCIRQVSPRLVDLTGRVFGSLTVTGRADRRNGNTMWECACTCGQQSTVLASHLIRGNTRSCGCALTRPDHELTYFGAHGRVKAKRGSASQYPCVDCGGSARDWSLKNNPASKTYMVPVNGSMCRISPDPDDYEPRCVPCHRAYDATPLRIGTHRTRRPAKRDAVDRTCGWCQKSFDPPASRIGRPQTYCSDECRTSANRARSAAWWRANARATRSQRVDSEQLALLG